MNKRLAAIAVAVAAIAAAGGLFASTSSGAAKAQRTIGLIDPAPNSSIAPYVEAGGQAAATALGDQLAIKEAPDTATQNSAIESLIAQHVAAIAVDNEGLGPAVRPSTPAALEHEPVTIAVTSKCLPAWTARPEAPTGVTWKPSARSECAAIAASKRANHWCVYA